MGFSISDAMAYLIVGVLTCITTLVTVTLNQRFGKKIKPDHSAQAGYSEWVAYLERELKEVKRENRELNRRVDDLEDRLREKDTLINRMKSKLLEFSRKYNEDVSNVI